MKFLSNFFQDIATRYIDYEGFIRFMNYDPVKAQEQKEFALGVILIVGAALYFFLFGDEKQKK